MANGGTDHPAKKIGMSGTNDLRIPVCDSRIELYCLIQSNSAIFSLIELSPRKDARGRRTSRPCVGE